MGSVGEFEDSLGDAGVSVRRVEPPACSAVLSELVEPPAIGVELPFSAAHLPGAVETDFEAADLRTAQTGVTPAGIGIADYGTVTVRSTDRGEELVAVYPPRHVVVLSADDVVPDMAAAFDHLEEGFEAGWDTQVFATGPSTTADMGKLVEGVHGPTDVHVVILDDD